jgi:hypothetical protein
MFYFKRATQFRDIVRIFHKHFRSLLNLNKPLQKIYDYKDYPYT